MTLQCSACGGAHERVEQVWRCQWIIKQAHTIVEEAMVVQRIKGHVRCVKCGRVVHDGQHQRCDKEA